jgi:hypothetical protein
MNWNTSSTWICCGIKNQSTWASCGGILFDSFIMIVRQKSWCFNFLSSTKLLNWIIKNYNSHIVENDMQLKILWLKKGGFLLMARGPKVDKEKGDPQPILATSPQHASLQ